MDSGTDPSQVELGFRKLYLRFILKALAGIAVLALIGLLPLPSKWWGIPFLLVGAWLILVNLNAIAILAKAHHRYAHGPEDTTPLQIQDRAEQVVHVASYVVLFLAMGMTAVLGRHAENIMEEGRFVLIMGGMGVVFAAFVAWLVGRFVPLYYQRNSEARGGAVLGLFLGITLIIVLGSAWVDRRSAEANVSPVRFGLERPLSATPRNGFVVLLRPDGENTFRIKLRTRELEQIIGRDSVDLLVGRSDLGFDHVIGVALP